MDENKLKSMMHQIVINTGIKLDGRKITNYSGCRTAIMMLKAFDISEDETMIFSGHGSHEGIRAYNIVVMEVSNLSNQSQETTPEPSRQEP
ncbi:11060_t:CDS:2, partial [Cetraspora pellucida]